MYNIFIMAGGNTMTGVIYARYSSSNQCKESIDRHIN